MAGSKILFIEDDRVISDMYSRALTAAGYVMDFAYTGTDGLQKAQSGDYNLILLDIMMPEKTGIEILHELRGEANTEPAHSKILILTNLAQDEASETALRAQADGYLIKADIVPSKLVEIVKQLLPAATEAALANPPAN
jgi:DNA-binding response OmpR family regulator